MSPQRNIVDWCETHPHDPGRGVSTIGIGDARAKCAQNDVELGAAMGRAVVEGLNA